MPLLRKGYLFIISYMIDFLTEALFTEKECKEILELNSGFKPLQDSEVEVAIPNKRKSYFGKVTNIEKLESLILPKVSKYGIKSLKNSQPMFIQYREGDYFEPHTDTPYSADKSDYRIYTLIIQLSEPSHYSGGTLLVENNTGSKELGSVIIFRSNKVHELTEVKSGERNIIVCMFPETDLNIKQTNLI